MRYAVALGNPPYNKNLHLKIIDGVIPHMEEDGTGCFVHPARWLEDPVADYKRNPDRLKFKGIVDRLKDVKRSCASIAFRGRGTVTKRKFRRISHAV